MRAAGEKLEAAERLLDVLGLDQDAAADRNHGIGRQDVAVGEVGVVGDQVACGFGLGAGEAACERARHLAFARGFVDRGGAQGVGLDAHLRQQHHTARAGAGEYQARLEIGAAADGLVARALTAQRLTLRRDGASESREQP